MIDSALILPTIAFNSLTPSAQQEVLSAMGFSDTSQLNGMHSATIVAPHVDGEDGPAELTLAFARKLTNNLSDKTLTALKVIAQSDTAKFNMQDVIDATNGAKDYMDMRGVWAALTRRTRKILADSEADLIWWDKTGNEHGDGVDWVGAVSPLTHKSLKTYFGV